MFNRLFGALVALLLTLSFNVNAQVWKAEGIKDPYTGDAAHIVELDKKGGLTIIDNWNTCEDLNSENTYLLPLTLNGDEYDFLVSCEGGVTVYRSTNNAPLKEFKRHNWVNIDEVGSLPAHGFSKAAQQIGI